MVQRGRMKKFFSFLIGGFGVVFLALVASSFFLSKAFTVERSLVIDTTPERLYALLGDLERWPEWGPWMKEDPDLQITLGEKTKGVGASESWVGKDGDGRLVFTEADPAKGVSFDLYFNQDAFENKSSILYEKVAGGYEVTWSMSGQVQVPLLGGLLAKAMDAMVGPMFDQGLENLRDAAKAQ